MRKLPTIDLEKAMSSPEILPKYINVKLVLILVCQVCKHEWIPRNPERGPYKCPLCQSLEWKGEEEDDESETETRINDEDFGGFAGDVG